MKIIVPDYLLSNLFIVNSQRYFSWYENVGHPVFFSVDILLLGVGWQGDGMWYASRFRSGADRRFEAYSCRFYRAFRFFCGRNRAAVRAGTLAGDAQTVR